MSAPNFKLAKEGKCPGCEQVGLKTDHWGGDLMKCENKSCDILWFWVGGVYYGKVSE